MIVGFAGENSSRRRGVGLVRDLFRIFLFLEGYTTINDIHPQ